MPRSLAKWLRVPSGSTPSNVSLPASAPAAALSALSRVTLRTAGRLTGDPLAALDELNHALRRRTTLSLCTVAAVALPPELPGMASVVLAGHPPPLLVRGGDVRAVGHTGPLLGAVEAADWRAEPVELCPGDTLVLSIDSHVQGVAEKALQGAVERARTLRARGSGQRLVADSGSVVVMEAQTGRVVAMASYPSYDPSVFVGGASPAEYAELVGGRFHYQPGRMGGVDYPDSGYVLDVTHTVEVLAPEHPVCAGLGQSFIQ